MDKLTVSKFDGHDFAVWKFQMMGFLEYHGLLEIVDSRYDEKAGFGRHNNMG